LKNELFESFKQEVNGKKIAIIGLGVSNLPLINLLKDNNAKVTVFDKREKEAIKNYNELLEKGVEFSLGIDYLDNLVGFDYIFKSPSTRFDLPELEAERARGAIVTSEMEKFFEFCPAKIIAVTGSDGKTTTTTLVYKFIEAEGYGCHLGGNIGKPLFTELDNIQPDDYVVLELSSFQLNTIKQSPHRAIITNISPNHLDVHKDYEEYIDSKKNVFKYMNEDGLLVTNHDNSVTKDLDKENKGNTVFFSRLDDTIEGITLKDGYITVDDEKVVAITDMKLRGVHNIENLMAAIGVTRGIVKNETIISVVKNFYGVEHRLEFVREVDGVKFYNDSISSSPSRAIAGVNSFDEKLILIAGGYDKKVPFEMNFGNAMKDHVKKLVLVGATSDKIKEAVLKVTDEIEIIKCDTFEEAVLTSKKIAENGDVVLLSPGSASFDLFKNFEERGNTFKDIVNRM